MVSPAITDLEEPAGLSFAPEAQPFDERDRGVTGLNVRPSRCIELAETRVRSREPSRMSRRRRAAGKRNSRASPTIPLPHDIVDVDDAGELARRRVDDEERP
jgi:hypothetical protein